MNMRRIWIKPPCGTLDRNERFVTGAKGTQGNAVLSAYSGNDCRRGPALLRSLSAGISGCCRSTGSG
ncbi:hypothetical protein KCP76_20245 [Salmonella enterica subsp. enterica serovar Weltevreden]|nr:hypothetical protein KCP76_20245 [Salmonella enterica subsp. enterica serovar Weltevreden]